ncbi:hypothetical protein C1280_27665 [Gemmata obscuriglobus]|uniref:Uncharacterized protein n=1 Tax=Gemmata obscuriglobus TaxID=114 RepID=A0A2Z3HKR3_9BACT|nr:hypothetical protein C1280_27665 [Gemmata obscuriglobus]
MRVGGAPRGAGRGWRGSPPRGAVLGGPRCAAARWCGSVVAPRMCDAGAGSAEPQMPAQKPNRALHRTAVKCVLR